MEEDGDEGKAWTSAASSIATTSSWDRVSFFSREILSGNSSKGGAIETEEYHNRT